MFGFLKTKKYKCRDGTFRIVHRNVEDAFPLYIPGFDSKAESNVKILNKTNVKLKAEYKDKIQGLLINLDELNSNSLAMFRSAYMVFHGDPCGKIDFFQSQVEQLNRNYHFLSTLKIQINGLITLAAGSTSHDKIMKAYVSILDNMGIPNSFVAASAIKENTDAAKKWIGGNNEG